MKDIKKESEKQTSEKTPQSGSSRRKAYRMTAVITLVVLILIVLGLNVLVNALDNKFNLHVDLSEQKYYTIGDTTKSVLDSLSQDIYIYSLYVTGSEDAKVTELMRTYEAYSGKIHYENIDPSLNPAFTTKYDPEGAGISTGSLIVSNAAGDIYKVYTVYELYAIDATTYSVWAFQAEARVSTAIVYIETGTAYTIKLLSGHGEYAMSDLNEFVVSLNAMNYEIEQYDSTVSSEPLDPKLDLLMVISPAVDLTTPEYERIKEFLDAGGNAVFLMDYVIFDSATGYTKIILDPLSNFNSLLMMYDLKLNNDYIIGGNSDKLVGRVTAHIPDMYSHSITEDIIDAGKTPLLSDCSSITITNDEAKAGPLMQTDANSWAKAVSTSMSANKEDTDKTGPFVIAAVAQYGESRIALFGTSSFVLSNETGLQRSANEDLIVNTVNVLAGQTASLNITPKSLITGAMEFDNDAQSVLLEILVLAVIPAAILAFGFTVWIKRKRR